MGLAGPRKHPWHALWSLNGALLHTTQAQRRKVTLSLAEHSHNRRRDLRWRRLSPPSTREYTALEEEEEEEEEGEEVPAEDGDDGAV